MEGDAFVCPASVASGPCPGSNLRATRGSCPASTPRRTNASGTTCSRLASGFVPFGEIGRRALKDRCEPFDSTSVTPVIPAAQPALISVPESQLREFPFEPEQVTVRAVEHDLATRHGVWQTCTRTKRSCEKSCLNRAANASFLHQPFHQPHALARHSRRNQRGGHLFRWTNRKQRVFHGIQCRG